MLLLNLPTKRKITIIGDNIQKCILIEYIPSIGGRYRQQFRLILDNHDSFLYLEYHDFIMCKTKIKNSTTHLTNKKWCNVYNHQALCGINIDPNTKQFHTIRVDKRFIGMNLSTPICIRCAIVVRKELPQVFVDIKDITEDIKHV